jgi:hypothetical protein
LIDVAFKLLIILRVFQTQVPARDWPEGTMRPLYVYHGAYPSVVSANRGDTWLPSNLEGTDEQITAWGNESTITGYIPQVYNVQWCIRICLLG